MLFLLCFSFISLSKTRLNQSRSILNTQTKCFLRREEMFLTSMLVNSYELMNIWIGYNDLASRGSYVWSDNTRPAYTNWFNGQPDEGARRGSCVKASMNQGYRGFLSWTDDDCSTQNSFFCKKLKGFHLFYLYACFVPFVDIALRRSGVLLLLI